MRKVVVTIPAYNEEKTIGKVIRDVNTVMKNLKYSFKILVINDGSTDKTKEVAEKSGAIVHSHPINYGLAESFRTEIKKCLSLGADIIVHIDADSQYPAEDIPNLLKGVGAGYDLVLGSRFLGTIEKMPLIKKLGNRAFSKIISRITNVKITDAQTGLRAFTREVAKKVEIASYHTYTQEQIIRAVKEKFRIKEVPVHFAKRHDKSRLLRNPFEYAIKAWINILRIYRDYQPLKFFGGFGLLLFAIGFFIGLWVVYLFLLTGLVEHLPSAVLSVLLILMGIQIILFGFLADTMNY